MGSLTVLWYAPVSGTTRAAMTSKLSVKNYSDGAAKPVEPATVGGRRVLRLGARWALALNMKLIAALVWALIAAVLLVL